MPRRRIRAAAVSLPLPLVLAALCMPTVLRADDPPAPDRAPDRRTAIRAGVLSSMKEPGANTSQGLFIRILREAGLEAAAVSAEAVQAGGLDDLDIFIIGGGSGTKFNLALGPAGCAKVTEFIRNGGGGLASCAGGYSFVRGHNEPLRLLEIANARCLDVEDGRWARGRGVVAIAPCDPTAAALSMFYANGPIWEITQEPGFGVTEPLARFVTSVTKEGMPDGVMVGTPAILGGTFGTGRYVLFSGHPEFHSRLGSNPLVVDAARWVVRGPLQPDERVDWKSVFPSFSVEERQPRPTPAQSTPAQSTPAQSTPAQSTPAQSTPAQSSPAAVPAGTLDMTKFTLHGDPATAAGATWTYDSVDDGVRYALEGILHAPVGAKLTGTRKYPAVIVHHGVGSSPSTTGVSRPQDFPSTAEGETAPTPSTPAVMARWGLVTIACRYSWGGGDGRHKPDGLPMGSPVDTSSAAGARSYQVASLRADKTFQILKALPYVDTQKLASHGHSRGAGLNVLFTGMHHGELVAASHTAGGTVSIDGAYANPLDGSTTPMIVPDTGVLVATPYSIHHAIGDKGFPLALADRLDATLTSSGVPHEYHKDYAFAGVSDGMSIHRRIAYDPTMYERVRAWYARHGLFAR